MTLPVLDDIVISPLFYFISVWETPPRWCTNKITTTKCLRCNCTVWDWCSTSVRPVIGGSMSHNFTLITRWIFTCLSGWYCRKKAVRTALWVYQTQQLDEKNGAIQSVEDRDQPPIDHPIMVKRDFMWWCWCWAGCRDRYGFCIGNDTEVVLGKFRVAQDWIT